MPSLPPAIHLSFTTDGDGPLVVALHDVGRPSADLRKALKPLLKHHRVMVPELRGHGESPSPAGPWSIDDFASDVARLVAGEMHLAPLGNKTLIRDLVSEIAPPEERLLRE